MACFKRWVVSHDRVRPMKIRLHSATLACDLLSTIAYRAETRDGWQGPYRDSYGDARRDLRQHKREVKDGRRASE